MKKIVLFILPILSIGFAIHVQAQALSVSNIPEALKTEADIVVRYEEMVYDINSPTKATLTYKTAITIMNKAGQRYANMVEVYDQFSSIPECRATLYDANGVKVSTYKKSDFQDKSMISSSSLFELNRLKYLAFNHISYPYTIEYSYTKNEDGFIVIPTWKPITNFHVAVQASSYTLLCAENYKFNKIASEGLDSSTGRTGAKVTHTWRVSDFPAISYEPLAIGLDEVTPWVRLSPVSFFFDGSSGSLSDWASMGNWIEQLSAGRDVLSPAVVSKVKSLVEHAKDDNEKIQILYDYLQQHTRYVGVQLGIGGFQPIAAEKVAQVNYGDCKALSNYMKAILGVVGIKSHLIVIGNGNRKEPINPAYPSFGQTNHMILCIPTAADTTFLECTSQYYPLGFVGSGNANRNALLVDGVNSTLINMPVYHPADNYQKRQVDVSFNADDANIQVKTAYGYAQFGDNLRFTLVEPSEQRKAILGSVGIADAKLVDFSYLQPDKTVPELIETISLTSKQLLSKGGGGRLFLTANLFNRREGAPMSVIERKTYFASVYPYEDTDEILFQLPEGYQVEYLPGDVNIETEFGQFKATYVVEHDVLKYTRFIQIRSNRYPPEKYDDFVAFSKQMSHADKQKVVLAKSM